MQSSNLEDHGTGPGDPLEYQTPWLARLVCALCVPHEAFRVAVFIALNMDPESRTWSGELEDIADALLMPLAEVELSVIQLTNMGCLFTCQTGDQIECALNFNFNEWAAL